MRKIILGTLLVAATSCQISAAEAPPAIPTFADETASAGIDSTYKGEWEFIVGGGVATFDCNADGFADMVLAGGTNTAKFYRNNSKQGGALSFKIGRASCRERV